MGKSLCFYHQMNVLTNLILCLLYSILSLRHQIGDMTADDLGSSPRLGLLNEFVLGEPKAKFTTLCK